MPKKKLKLKFVVEGVEGDRAFECFEELPGCCGIGVAREFPEEVMEYGTETTSCDECDGSGKSFGEICYNCSGTGMHEENGAERVVPINGKMVLNKLAGKLPKSVLVALCGQPNATKAVLEAGFKVLGTCKSRDGRRTITLYGKGFTTPRGEKKRYASRP